MEEPLNRVEPRINSSLGGKDLSAFFFAEICHEERSCPRMSVNGSCVCSGGNRILR